MATLDQTLNAFRAAGEETRLRILALLQRGELTVSELTQILGQSQPRVSRHLKIMADAGLVERHREGSWIFYRAALDQSVDAAASLGGAVAALNASEDRVIARDKDRFEQSREARAAMAAAYFTENAAEWDRVRGLHIAEEKIEAAMRRLIGEKTVDLFVDLGTGTGRILKVFADAYHQGIGFDQSREMLAVARSNLDRDNVPHAQVRQADIFSLPVENGVADIVCLHHVLHYLAAPAAAVREAARVLKPGGDLLISDFAPHDYEFLREEHAHRRLGFSDEEVKGWCVGAGLDFIEAETLHPGAQSPGHGTSVTKRSTSKQIEPEMNDGLTVKIWLCRAPAAVQRLKKRDTTSRPEQKGAQVA